MDSGEFAKRLKEAKKEKVIEVVDLVCKRYEISKPKLNFKGCPEETQDELAHYHFGEHKICISELQLNKLKTLTDVENTTYHELTHILVQEHGGEFNNTMNTFKVDTWHPPRGAMYITHENLKEANKIKSKPAKIRIDKTRCNYHLCRKRTKLYQCSHCKNYYCKDHKEPIEPANLTSEWSKKDHSKTSYHPCPQYVDFLKKQKERQTDEYGKALDILTGKYNPKIDIEQPDVAYVTPSKEEEKIKQKEETKKKVVENPLTDEEQQELIKKIYKDYDSKYGEYGRRWNAKGKEVRSINEKPGGFLKWIKKKLKIGE